MTTIKDAYSLILEAIDKGVYKPGDRMLEADLADRLGMSRTPIREALGRLESQRVLARDGRSMVVATLDYNQMAELYVVRVELEALAARLAARHGDNAEIDILFEFIEEDQALIGQPDRLAETNKRFHRHIQLASRNQFLQNQLGGVQRAMALMARTSLAAPGRAKIALQEHMAIAEALKTRDEARADKAVRAHLYAAFKTRLREAKPDAVMDIADF